MPFTLAHPAIILPLNRFKSFVSMSSLVIGSITPDFEYFIRMKLTGRYSHSIEGMFVFDLPVAIIMALIFHQLVKRPLIDNLPQYFKERLMPLRQFNFLKYLATHYHVVVVCLLTGIASHILWDSFTHSNEYFVKRFELLRFPVSLVGLSVPVYRWLQHGSTIVGFIVIGVSFHGMPIHSSSKRVVWQFWVLIITAAIVSFLLRANLGFEYFGDKVATAISSICIGLIVSSLLFRKKHE